MLTDVKKYQILKIEAFIMPNDLNSIDKIYTDLLAFDYVECIYPDKIHVCENINKLTNVEAIKEYIKYFLTYAKVEVYEYRVYPDTNEFEKKKIDLSC